jgi:iron complex outermembrane recepter protein
MNHKSALAARTALSGAAVILGLCASGALAQETAPAEGLAADEAETIVVTGSRIGRADLEASSPVTIVSG